MRVEYIELAGEKYPMCFSLAAIERIEEEFGSLAGLDEALEYKQETGLSAVIQAVETVFGIFLEAGRFYTSLLGEEAPKLPCRVSDLMSLKEAREKIAAVISGGSAREVEAAAKNGEAAPPEEETERRGSYSQAPRQD